MSNIPRITFITRGGQEYPKNPTIPSEVRVTRSSALLILDNPADSRPAINNSSSCIGPTNKDTRGRLFSIFGKLLTYTDSRTLLDYQNDLRTYLSPQNFYIINSFVYVEKPPVSYTLSAGQVRVYSLNIVGIFRDIQTYKQIYNAPTLTSTVESIASPNILYRSVSDYFSSTTTGLTLTIAYATNKSVIKTIQAASHTTAIA